MVAGRRTAAVCAIWSAIAAACSSQDEDAASTSTTEDPDLVYAFGIPALAEDTHGPGTALGDGFEVAEGSILLGDVFPNDIAVIYAGQLIEDRGWTAHLLVDGDPLEVFDAYAAQAEAAGLPALPPADRTCVPITDGGIAAPVEVPPGEEAEYDETATMQGVECKASTNRSDLSSGDPHNERNLSIHLQRGPGAISHLFLKYTVTGEGTSVGPSIPPSPIDTGYLDHFLSQLDELTAPEDQKLPEVGDDIGVFDGMTGAAVTVAPGTEVVAVTPHPDTHCAYSLHPTILRLTGDLAAVLDRYASEIEAAGIRSPETSTYEDDGFTISNVTLNVGAGGGLVTISAYEPDDSAEPTYITVRTCSSS